MLGVGGAIPSRPTWSANWTGVQARLEAGAWPQGHEDQDLSAPLGERKAY